MGVGIMKRRHRRKINAQARKQAKRGRRKSCSNSKRKRGWSMGIRSRGFQGK